MVVYLDILFLINFIMNYVVLVLSSGFGGISSKTWKVLIGSLVGAIYAVLTFFHFLDFLNFSLVKILACILITYISFGRQHIIKNTVLVIIVSSILAGVIMAIFYFSNSYDYMIIGGVPYIDISISILISVFILCYLALSVLHRGLYKNKTSNITSICIEIQGKKKTISAFVDTGNVLKDNITGKSVIIIEALELFSILPLSMKKLCRRDGFLDVLEKQNNVCNVRLIHYKSLGNQNGTMVVLKPDAIYDVKNNKIDALIGISYDALAINGAKALMGV